MKKKQPAEVLTFGDLVFDQSQQEVMVNGIRQHLTPKECQLLAIFMQHPGEVLTREFLMRKIWQDDLTDNARTLQTHVSSLRRKIEADPRRPRLIQTVSGWGYIFGASEVGDL